MVQFVGCALCTVYCAVATEDLCNSHGCQAGCEYFHRRECSGMLHGVNRWNMLGRLWSYVMPSFKNPSTVTELLSRLREPGAKAEASSKIRNGVHVR